MNTLYIITGANGHLGSCLCHTLRSSHNNVRAFVLPNEDTSMLRDLGCEIVVGDVTNENDVKKLFWGLEDTRIFFIHAAGIVDINSLSNPAMEKVNIGGTKNIVDECVRKRVEKFVYVSSVHAIPEPTDDSVICEVSAFNGQNLIGAYSRTKATASQYVLDNVANGLNAIIVHPSGIIGPFKNDGNHLVQMIKDYLLGHMRVIVPGGYDFVDVRDCADGIISAVSNGKIGQCYILSNHFYQIKEILGIIRYKFKTKRFSIVPMWFAKSLAPLLASVAKRRGEKPLFTKYSLYALLSKSKFSHQKATDELGYHPRCIVETLTDTVKQLQMEISAKAAKAPIAVKKRQKSGS